MSRIVIIGLDGADFSVLKPLVAAGRLPHLGGLLSRGASGPLRSTYPPMSPAAWTSFMTGKDPGKHGIFDFTARRPDSYEVEFVNARFRRAATVWKLMSEAGKRVCVLSVPITYPPEQLNGIQISGIDTPGIAGGLADPSAMHPPGLHQELLERLGGYLVSPNLKGLIGAGPEDYIRAAWHTIDRKMDAARYLYGKEPWDCFMITIGETDGIAHKMWHYHDRDSPLGDERSRAHRGPDPVASIYERIDGHVGKLLEALHPETTVFVVSDHGHAGNGERAVHLNRWLAQQSFLGFDRSLPRRLKTWLLDLAKRAGTRNLIPLEWRKRLLRRTGVAAGVESYLRFGQIDWSRTLAYSEETPYYPTLWLNVRGREPRGIVAAGAEYEATRERIATALESWKDPATGRPVVKKAWKREELYHGDFVAGSPDLVPEWNLDGNYSYVFRPSRAAEVDKPAVARLEGIERGRAKPGDHRDHGLLIAAGHEVRPGAIAGATLLDMAPTFLHLVGLPVPRDMDGSVLREALSEGFLNRNPVRLGDPAAAASPDAEAGAYSEEEEEAVRRRLQGLGYME